MRGRRSLAGALEPRIKQRRPDHARLLRHRCRSEPDQGQERRGDRLRQPGVRPCQQPARQRRAQRGGRAAPRLGIGRQGGERRLSGDGAGRGGGLGGRGHGPGARRAPGRPLPRSAGAQPQERRRARVRARLQHPLPADRAAAGSGRVHDRAQRAGPPRARRVRARRRRALPGRDPSGRRAAARSTWRCPTAPRSAAAAPGSSRPPSARSARPTCSASRWCCAAACAR